MNVFCYVSVLDIYALRYMYPVKIGETQAAYHYMKHVHNHCENYRNFTYSPGVEFLWKGTVFA